MNERQQRGGFLLWLILMVAIVLSILLYSYSFRASGAYRTAANIYHGRLASQLAAAAVEVTLASLRECADVEELALRRRFVVQCRPDEVDGLLDVTRAIPGFDERLERLRTSVFGGRGVDVTVTVRIANTVHLVAEDEPHLGRDPREKRGSLIVRATVTVQRARKTKTVVRPFKVVNLVPPVVSRFTLFVLHPEPNGFNPDAPGDRGYEGYNRYRNRIDGAPTAARPNYHPLVVYNHPRGQTLGVHDYDHRTLGWIFLGEASGRDVVLHLTSGSHNTLGEYFHYKSLEYNNQLQAARRLEYLVDEGGEKVPIFFKEVFGYTGGAHGSSIDFVVKRRRLGFFEEDLKPPPAGNMDCGLLAIDCSTFTVASSMLHLFGSNKEASPTLVIGSVLRAYPEYAGVVADVDGDGVQDGTLKPLLAHSSDVLPSGALPPAFQVRGVTYRLEDLVGPASFVTPRERSYSNPAVFNDSSFTYGLMMSQIVYEAYNRGVDAMAASGLTIPPPPYRRFEEDYYPRRGEHVAIPFLGQDRAYYEGNLNTFTDAALRRRLTYRFATLDEFLEWTAQVMTGDEDVLALGYNVRIDEERLDLRRVATVRDGGTLAGASVVLKSLARRGHVPVSLVALQGDIDCYFTGPVQASLVALDGELITCGGNAVEVNIEGNLAVDRLPPRNIRRGGSLRYDTDLDPTIGRNNGYDRAFRVFIADGSKAWGG